MWYLRDLLGAHFAAGAGAAHILDEAWLPRWLDRRLGWTRDREARRHRRVERMVEAPPKGKDVSKDW